MLYVETDGTIRLTRGDTATLQVPIKIAGTDQDYEMSGSDTLTFSIKKTCNDEAPLFQKIVTGTNVLVILPADTKALSFGKYLYDVELKKSETEVYTVIVPTTFEVLKEVT